MVDPARRAVAARVLKDFASGTTSNDEFERDFPHSDQDAALQGIKSNVWMLYSDLKTHKLTGKYDLPADTKALLERCVLFLHSDLEFEWPLPRIALRNLIPNALSSIRRVFGAAPTENRASGDEGVWPFFREQDYFSQLDKHREQ